MPVSKTDIPPELKSALTRGINALSDLPDKAGAVFDRYDLKPQQGSKASFECEEFPESEAPMTAPAKMVRQFGRRMVR